MAKTRRPTLHLPGGIWTRKPLAVVEQAQKLISLKIYGDKQIATIINANLTNQKDKVGRDFILLLRNSMNFPPVNKPRKGVKTTRRP